MNIDSQAPNKIMAEWLSKQDYDIIQPEYIYGNSRIDFYMERRGQKCLLEVKGCTLERDGVGYFPDAPTERGVKHLRELTKLKQNGIDAHVLFIVQMQDVISLQANRETDPAFADALLAAKEAGVGIHAVDCLVTPTSVLANEPIPIEYI